MNEKRVDSSDPTRQIYYIRWFPDRLFLGKFVSRFSDEAKYTAMIHEEEIIENHVYFLFLFQQDPLILFAYIFAFLPVENVFSL